MLYIYGVALAPPKVLWITVESVLSETNISASHSLLDNVINVREVCSFCYLQLLHCSSLGHLLMLHLTRAINGGTIGAVSNTRGGSIQ
jgi:hypothetical protein